MTPRSRVFLGLGSNVGNREYYLTRAIDEMEKCEIKVVQRSSIYQTDAWGIRDQSPFLNQVVEVSTEVSPEHLLLTLQSIEKKLGRQYRRKWREREIDLDILYFDDRIIDSDKLQIPHVFVQERKFVLIPLHEIAPDFADPRSGNTICELLASCTDESRVSNYTPTV